MTLLPYRIQPQRNKVEGRVTTGSWHFHFLVKQLLPYIVLFFFYLQCRLFSN